MDFSCDYWFGIFPYVFYSKKGNKVLLYNTRQGVVLKTEVADFIALIDEMHQHHNLGVISLKGSMLKQETIRQLIGECVDKKIGFCFPITETNSVKPVQMMPVLNLQRDVDKLSAENDRAIGEDIIHYLLNLTIHVNSSCQQNCTHCNDFNKQFVFCKCSSIGEQLSLTQIEHVFQQIEYAPLQKLTITGGNIFQYSELEGLLALLKKYSYQAKFGIHYLNCSNDNYALLDDFSKDIFITFPVMDQAENLPAILKKGKVKIHFIVSSESDYQQAETIIQQYGITDYQVLPFFDGANRTFFEENVFMSEDDILASPIKQRIVFANQKLNTNFFGALFIFPDGTVHANHNAPAIGNIDQQSILDLLNCEMIHNTAWRQIRNQHPCTECIYQYLCPSPSNYEQVFGKMNLCSVME